MTAQRKITPKSARERLVHHVQELERLEEVKQAAAEALRDAFKSAAGEGFDRETLRAVLKLRKLSPAERQQRRALEAIYLADLGMLDGEPLPDEARRRLDEQPGPGNPKATPETAEDVADLKRAPEAPKPAQLPMNVKDPKEAKLEGRAAAAAGKRIYDNPYPAGDPCRAAWDEGWCESNGSHGMDTPAAFQRRKEKPPAQPAPPDDADDDGAEEE